MKLAVVAGRHSRIRARRVARSVGLSLGDITTVDADRILVVGDESDLAGAVHARSVSGLPMADFAHPGPGSLATLFAHAATIPAAVERLTTGTPYPCDLGVLVVGGTKTPFVGSVRSGAGGRADLAFPWWGQAGTVTVQASRTVTVERAKAVTVSNAQASGMFTIAPRAAVMDGVVDIQIFHGPPHHLVRLRSSVRTGLHERSPLVSRVRAGEAAVTVPGTWMAVADGRPAGRGSFTVSVHRGAFRLLV